jgi:hypothetical protein
MCPPRINRDMRIYRALTQTPKVMYMYISIYIYLLLYFLDQLIIPSGKSIKKNRTCLLMIKES